MNLSNMIITRPLNEADSTSKYGLSSNTTNSINYQNDDINKEFNNIMQSPDAPVNQVPMDNTIPVDQPTVDPAAVPQENQPVMDTQQPQAGTEQVPAQEPTPNEDDPTSVADDTQVAGGTDNPQDVAVPEDPNAAQTVPMNPGTDMYTDAQMNMPGDMAIEDFDSEEDKSMKELRGLSDREYKLCNANLKDKFISLQDKASDIIKSDVSSITTSNPRLQQAIDIVHSNLDSFIDDIQNFIMFNYSTVYESNIDVYMKFAKRLRLTIGILCKVKKENAKEESKN